MVYDCSKLIEISMKFEILEPSSVRWGELFNSLSLEQRDVFYAPDFAQLCQDTLNASDEVKCATLITGDGGILLYPFVERNIGQAFGAPFDQDLNDTISLYGRGGIVGDANEQDVQVFYTLLEKYFEDRNVFCSFDRFHPVIANHGRVSKLTKVMDVGGFVVVDIRPTLEEVVMSFKPSVRKDIRKAERNNIECFCEGNSEHLESFLEIYYQTMDRNSAGEFHYFSKEFFNGLSQYINGKFLFFYAVYQGTIVSCELVLYHGNYAHSFLGGTRADALPLAANPMLKKAILQKMKSLGCHFFLLGGGHQPNDGIFNFKKAYAPQGVYPSYVGGSIWKPEIYQGLKQDLVTAGHKVSVNRFQFYDVVG